ncbi:hemerythrin subunit alpha-like [Lingula anatina]|uniref:Hemerythrin subunit alpha-like n=1 Tax=Lingula anatina TaxID=7574 RepID=A0A1S3IQ21_LINAN|nr:hemerythrin subunit alpha-like [Lingula anatina]|eukprot:XP_013400320.1 hemerythrin subunit alpha-like [Lingula anatina]
MAKIPAPFEWSEEFKTGYESLDNEHRTLFNSLFALSEFNTRDQLEACKECFVMHFRDEQGQMLRANYVHMDEHTAIHESFLEQLGKWKAPVAQGDIESGMKWLTHHIPTEDFKYKNKL